MLQVSTYVIHDGEGYIPDGINVRPWQVGDSMYGYNDQGDIPDFFEGESMGGTIVIEGDLPWELAMQWFSMAILCTRIRGADDDHYDYFPSAFDGLADLAHQIDKITGGNPNLIEHARKIWTDHAYDLWSSNYVNKESVEFAANEFAQEIVPSP